MIQMSELVKDPVYRSFLTTQPAQPAISVNKKLMSRPPWVVYVQREKNGPWGKKEFWKYTKAFKFFRKALKAGVYDCTINNRRIGFKPPQRFVRIKGKYVVGSDGVRRQQTKPVPWVAKIPEGQPDHHWCKHCRRPTVFRYYKKHKALKGVEIDTTIPRCCICGASARIAIDHASDKGFRFF